MTTIILAADENYLPYVPCNIAQIARFGTRAEGVVLAVPSGIDADLVAQAQSAAAAHGMGLDVIRVSELAPLRNRRVISDVAHISYFTYSKLVLAEILRDLDDVLYLDVDTLVRAPLDDLLDWELRHPVAAVQDWGSGLHLYGTPRRPYFNAGVLRLSLARLRRERTWDQARQILETRELKVVDQDVFNLLFGNRFENLPTTFNVFDRYARQHKNLAAFHDPVIVHFAGSVKPWHRSATSQFALEWRRRYEEAGADQAQPLFRGPRSEELASRRGAYVGARRAGRGRLFSTARAVLPANARPAARNAAADLAERAVSRLEDFKAALQPRPAVYPLSATADTDRTRVPNRDGGSESGLDLLISLPRSGTNAFGNAVAHSRPHVHWLNELYLGLPDGLREGELVDRFPWFSDGDPMSRAAMSPTARNEAMHSFAATTSEHALELTGAVLETRQGRTLIKVLPEQLSPAAFQEVLAVFRPRLLYLRRELVFTYISLLRARRAQSWWESDSSDVPYNLTDAAALQYAVHADGWINFVAQLAGQLGLESVCLTYNGVFTTGSEIPIVESFYPGPPIAVDKAGRLLSDFVVQDRRSDASVLTMLQSFSRLSAATQSRLLRLPGNQGSLLNEKRSAPAVQGSPDGVHS